MTDWAHTPTAEWHRNAKAALIAATLREAGVTSAQVDAYTEQQRRSAEQVCGVRTSHPQELWLRVLGLLREVEAEALPPPQTGPTRSGFNAPDR